MTLDFAGTEAAIRESVVANVAERDVVVVSGEDAASFLQGQMSQNVEQIEVGGSAHTFLLQPQGKIAAWGRISRVATDEFWFDTDLGYGALAAQRLERFLLRVKCTVASETWPIVQLRGPQAPAVPGSLAVLWRGELLGYDVLGPDASVPEGIPEGDPAAFAAQRIDLGWPTMGAEIGESTIPAELGVVDDSADFTKGCYVGQELVARIDSRGNNTPRRMQHVRGDGSPPSSGAAVRVNDSDAGIITSAAASSAGWVGLASIKRGVEMPNVGDVDGQEVVLQPLS